ncbi:hypothetical protein [Nocardia sp. NPDC058633]|uniref:hypothetical protein n=1 Tax=Nocardia sp. NPDC058633 TaxID=3346568 RepID=UPI003652DE45
MANIPTEDEIRSAAKELGLADESGNYPRHLRNRIARTIQIAKQEQATAADPAAGLTAEQLAQFAAELTTAGPFTAETSTAVLVEAARYLLETQGLRLAPKDEGETTP